MTTVLITGAALLALLATWRLRHAAGKLRRMLAEEAARPADTEESERAHAAWHPETRQFVANRKRGRSGPQD